MRIIAISTFAAGLAACTTIGEVTPVGKDTYIVGVEVRGGENWTKVKGHALTRANEFCDAKGMRMELEETTTSGARGWTPQGAEVRFRCVPKD